MLKLSFLNLLRHKTRTFLSVAGIAIGVMAIIGMVSVVDGIQSEITTAFGKIQGVNVLQKGSMGPLFSTIDESLGDKIESMQGIRVVMPTIIAGASTVEGEPIPFGFSGIRIVGSDLTKLPLSRAGGVEGELSAGRALKPGDKGKVIAGQAIADEYKKTVGSSIKIDGERFTIVGIYTTGSSLFDSSVVADIGEVRDLVSFPNGKVSFFNVELDDPAQEAKMAKLIKFRFPTEVDTYTASSISQQFSDVLGSLRLMVFLIAGITAFVAAIGIINTVLMSVLERFGEIGALKAVGWADSDVMKMIVLESAFIGVLGGAAGIFLGSLAALGVEEALGIKTMVSPMLVVEVFLFAVFVGLFSGLYPAYVASKMDPIEALRAE